MTAILVTGGAGYIGSHMVRYLLKNGYSPIILDNLVYGHKESLPPKVKFYRGDIGDQKLLKNIFQKHKITAVMHFSAYAYVGESVENPEKYYLNNLVKTIYLLNAMHAANIPNFIFSSSCATYGNTTQSRISESHPQAPINPYGYTKLAVEHVLADYAAAYGLSYSCLRYFNAAGAADNGELGESHDPETHLIPLALQTITEKNKLLKIFGTDYPTPDGTCIRDYIHVNDLADAHLKALQYIIKTKGSLCLNLGSEHGSSIREVLKMCEKISGQKVSCQESDRRAGDPPVLVADSSQAKKILKWQPKYSLEDIIRTAWQWEKNRKF